MPSYTLNMPQGTQTLAQTQQPINDNFSVINSTISTNHVPLTDGTAANRGKHNLVVMPVQAAGPVTGATETAIYTKSLAGTPTVYFRKNNSGTEVQMTGPGPTFTAFVYNGQPALRANTFLAGGLLLQYGYFYYGHNTEPTVAYATSFSGGFAAYSIQLTGERASGSTSDQALYVVEGFSADTGFKMRFNTGGDHYVYWTAIGPS